MTGASEKALRRTNRPFHKVYVHPAHHAGYYPGAEQMTLKLLFDPQSGRVLGAQAVGGPGVDKRIDVLAVAIQADMTVFDLEEMELAYAPQYGSAKDPINMAGFVAGGMLRGEHPQVDVEAVLASPPDQRPFVVDVRTPQEFSTGNIAGAVNIPVDDLRSRLGELPRDREIAAYCQVGQRGYLATRILRQKGFSASNIGGGYKTYRLFHPKGILMTGPQTTPMPGEDLKAEKMPGHWLLARLGIRVLHPGGLELTCPMIEALNICPCKPNRTEPRPAPLAT